jgi:uncharacterized membrane protein
MDLDRALITIHVLAAVIWVGGAFASQLYAIRAQLAGPDRMADLLGDIEWLGTRIFTPVSIVLLGCGVWLVSRDVFTMQTWTWIGAAGFATSFVIGAGFLGPETGRIRKLLVESGPDAPEAIARIKRIFIVSRVELVVLLLVVLDMAWKPFT